MRRHAGVLVTDMVQGADKPWNRGGCALGLLAAVCTLGRNTLLWGFFAEKSAAVCPFDSGVLTLMVLKLLLVTCGTARRLRCGKATSS